MKTLVTGTAGFIGYHLAKNLLARGDEVVGLDNINNYYDVDLKYARLLDLGIDRKAIIKNEFTKSDKFKNHKFIKANLQDKEIISSLFESERFDVVVNLAAQAGVRYSIENPHAYIESNVVGFINILEGCRKNKIKKLCFASSSSVYGLNERQPFKTTDVTDTPVSLYAATKKSNELMAHSYSHLYGIQATGLRFFTVYGPWGRPDMAPMLFTDAIYKNKPINVFNHGEMSRDFTYIDDIVDGIIKVVDNPTENTSVPFKIYNIGNSSPVKLLDFIEMLENSVGIKAEKNYMGMQDGDVVSTYADINDLINDFNYKPKTKLASGVHEFVKWYKGFYKVESS